jgi:hypothetical protein
MFKKLRNKDLEDNLEQKVDKSPVDLENYLGTVYVTKNNSKYEITDEGEFKGRPSIEGAKISMAAGIDESVMSDFLFCMSADYDKAMEEFDYFVQKYGQKLRPGLRLVASLTPEARREKHRVGIITSPISSIEYAR